MTREQAAKWLPIITAYAEGKPVEWLFDGTWVQKSSDYVFDEPPENYRIKRELKLRPWKSQEVPVGAIARYKTDNLKRVLIRGADGSFVYGVDDMHRLDFEEVMNRYEHSTDGGKTWLPCGVMEEA